MELDELWVGLYWRVGQLHTRIGVALTALKDPYFHSLDENQSSFAAPVTFPS